MSFHLILLCLVMMLIASIQVNFEKKNTTDTARCSSYLVSHLYLHPYFFLIHKAKYRETRTPLKVGGELVCSEMVFSSCTTGDIRRATLVTNSVMRKWSDWAWLTSTTYTCTTKLSKNRTSEKTRTLHNSQWLKGTGTGTG